MFMTGALCVIGQGSSLKPLIAVLFQLTFLLVVLKLAPYADDDDDLSSFISSLAIVLTCLFGFALTTATDEYGGDDNSIATWIVVIGAASIVAELVIMGRGEFRRRRALRRTKAQASGPKVSPVAGGGSGLNQRARQAWKDDGSN